MRPAGAHHPLGAAAVDGGLWARAGAAQPAVAVPRVGSVQVRRRRRQRGQAATSSVCAVDCWAGGEGRQALPFAVRRPMPGAAVSGSAPSHAFPALRCRPSPAAPRRPSGRPAGWTSCTSSLRGCCMCWALWPRATTTSNCPSPSPPAPPATTRARSMPRPPPPSPTSRHPVRARAPGAGPGALALASGPARSRLGISCCLRARFCCLAARPRTPPGIGRRNLPGPLPCRLPGGGGGGQQRHLCRHHGAHLCHRPDGRIG